MFIRLGRIFRTVWRDGVVLWHACRHPQAPRSLKAGALLLALYVISPIDLIPDWFPFLGWMDDAAVLAFAIPFLLKLAPRHVVEDARFAAQGMLFRKRH